MKTYKTIILTGSSLILCMAQVLAQINFDSGSDESDGAINITSNTTMVLPPDGIIHATTIDVAAGFTLAFTKNEFNTPVYLLATGNVTIAGTINVSGGEGSTSVGGQPGPGGFDGGAPGSAGVSPGDGLGPGGGKAGGNSTGSTGAGSGSYGDQSVSGSSTGEGAVYGSPLLIPLTGGSGGGGTSGTPGNGGGGGGGALLIASNTQVELASTGVILAQGGRFFAGAYNGGSGGAVRLVAPHVFGSGAIRAESLRNDYAALGNSFAGFGRIRVDTIDRSGISITFDPSAFTSVGSNLVVFPTPTPRLDITEVAGTNVALDTTTSEFVLLDFNEDPNKTVTVRAENFNKVVNIAVVLQPVNGDRIIYEDSIDNSSSNNPASKAVNVVFPLNTQTKVFVWTRPDA
ncbi:MAG: hypothetical protein O3C43_13975 [Verrucomicrobia bacterium]|nr:hypothetical protein [Verrucomicrobiota bacterium]MDA1067599.1 hypothetical protein [Verrucomicrobiota bacterium]